MNDSLDAAGGDSPDVAVPARRKALVKLTGAAPVMLTFAARPVQAVTCAPASSFASLNASRQGTTATCSGRFPSYWATTPSAWPPDLKSKTFTDIFGVNPFSTGAKLTEVVGYTTAGMPALAAHLVAAYVNAYLGLVPANVLSTATTVSVWQSHRDLGFYRPSAGITWTIDQTLMWIKSTMA